jgi:hypothetical protein
MNRHRIRILMELPDRGLIGIWLTFALLSGLLLWWCMKLQSYSSASGMVAYCLLALGLLLTSRIGRSSVIIVQDRIMYRAVSSFYILCSCTAFGLGLIGAILWAARMRTLGPVMVIGAMVVMLLECAFEWSSVGRVQLEFGNMASIAVVRGKSSLKQWLRIRTRNDHETRIGPIRNPDALGVIMGQLGRHGLAIDSDASAA